MNAISLLLRGQDCNAKMSFIGRKGFNVAMCGIKRKYDAFAWFYTIH